MEGTIDTLGNAGVVRVVSVAMDSREQVPALVKLTPGEARELAAALFAAAAQADRR
jgi:hypothetical protein